MSPKADAVIADGYGGDEVEAAEIGRDAVDALLALHPEGVAILPDREVRADEAPALREALREAAGFLRHGQGCGFYACDGDCFVKGGDQCRSCSCGLNRLRTTIARLVSVSEAPTRMEEP